MESGISATKFDWARCIFCQTETRDKTMCPGLSTRPDVGAGYKTLAENVLGYKEIGMLPPCVNLTVWDEGDGIENTCRKNNACWHAKCRQLLHPTKLERMRSKRLRAPDDEGEGSELVEDYETPGRLPRLTRSSSGFVETAFSSVCFFCEKEGKDNRRTVMTDPVNERVNRCAEIIQDPLLLAKLTQGDLIAIEAQYHPECLLALCDKASRIQKTYPDIDETFRGTNINAESLALADIIAYMEEVRSSENTPSVFTLSKLVDLYMEQLQLHGVVVVNRIQSTRFKDRLLENCPDLTAVNHGRDVLLTFNDNLGIALTKLKDNSDSDAVLLMHTAKLIRREIFQSKELNFNGSFNNSSQLNSTT